jgi:hypothetical protein
VCVGWIATAHDGIANRREWVRQADLNGSRLRSRRHGNEHQIDGEKGSARHMLLPVGWGLADNL